MWHKIAIGNALEEQKKELRRNSIADDSKPPAREEGQSDEEADPNDPRPPAAQHKTYARDPYDSISDDDSDY